MKFVLKRSGNQWWFRIVARNGRILANSERYKERRKALHAIELIRRWAIFEPTVVER